MWVILGGWDALGYMGHYFGWVGVTGALFWAGECEWGIILGGWGWVVMSGGGCTV